MNVLDLGIDVGSTTAKIVVLDAGKTIVFSAYTRHKTQITETLVQLFSQVYEQFNHHRFRVAFSGSAGMGLAELTHSLFTQEVLATTIAIKHKHEHVKSLIDIGGEDGKLVLFNNVKKPDIRMNGNCAGGTGAFIDQMATLLNITPLEMNDLAWKSTTIYPIASRCGVFAKTDVQNLISRKIPLADIAASIFHAVSSQVINSLARGCTINPAILFCGGPLTFLSYLRKSILDLLKIDESHAVLPANSELFVAFGTALSIPESAIPVTIDELTNGIKKEKSFTETANTLTPLFSGDQEFNSWMKKQKVIPIPARVPENTESCFLGIDSGSTTTKIVVASLQGELLYTFYKNNNGKPLETAIEGLEKFKNELELAQKNCSFIKSAVTGYGEDLIRSALGLDYGIVETVAHFMAAQHIEPQVSFILDIGGQDIKAIQVQNHTITNIEINEACSSGCGSFIEGFAQTLGFKVSDFSQMATQAKAPYDLGSRCTVFMNSKVKQAIRDGASVEDLSAGLCYSVIKNCLYKVLKLQSNSGIGQNIVVQGGTFRNQGVFRALELLSGKNIYASDKPELMGAYGAALYAIEKFNKQEKSQGTFTHLTQLESLQKYNTRISVCSGCTNNCTITVYKFSNEQRCYSGNKCEKIFSNNPVQHVKAENVFEFKRQILFEPYGIKWLKSPVKIGIPRALNMYENYPFWQALFYECGIQTVLSDESNSGLFKSGDGSVMSDNICFPAKLAHGHIVNLINKKVDRIFFPMVIYEEKSFKDSANSFNCPVISGYSEVLKSTHESESGIPIDAPGVNFNNIELLKKACLAYLKQFGISKGEFEQAFKVALQVKNNYKNNICNKNKSIYEKARANREPVILLASHPYHTDPLVHQQASQILADLGVHVINEEIPSSELSEGFKSYYTISQWEYPNRILQAAWWVANQDYPVGLIQLNSFGCGPDSFIMDEVNDLAKKHALSFAMIRIDEISSPGSLKLRLRSLVESIKLRNKQIGTKPGAPVSNQKAIFDVSDKDRTIIVPWFSDFYSPFIPVLAKQAGYNFVNLPPSNPSSVQNGLSFANNEVCYPATLIVGDVINALKSNKYDLSKVAVGITQTGGQCRATNYLSLIRRALANAGFEQVPVISVAASKDMYNYSQPGFNIDWKKLIKPVFNSLLFADSLSRLYYSFVSRVVNVDECKKLRDSYLQQAVQLVAANRGKEVFPLIKEAVAKFNELEVNSDTVQAVGIVGEIYIKYNSFGQYNVVDWLIEHKIEVVLPPLFEFMMQAFINDEAMMEENIIQPTRINIMNRLFKWAAERFIFKFEKELKKSKFYRPVYDIDHSANLASEIVSLANQFGEGWLIPAEIASFARQQIDDVVCMQPFGCIANHIVGKGVEKKIKELYPNMNLLYLDFDHGISKVNVLNRMHALIQNI